MKSNIFSLQGKRAFITGAAGHLGSTMVFALAEAGAHVIVNGRDKTKCECLTDKLLSKGYQAEAAVFDVTEQDQVERYFADHADPLHVIVNNAYAGGAGNIKAADIADYLKSYEVTVIAAHRILKASLSNLERAVAHCGYASIINIASMYGTVSPDQTIYETDASANPPFYGAAKAALLQWTRYAACEFGPKSIRVNAISPGPFPSIAVQKSSPVFVEKLIKKVPMGKIGFPNDLRGPVVFLASEASSFVNGANIAVDGGWTCL